MPKGKTAYFWAFVFNLVALSALASKPAYIDVHDNAVIPEGVIIDSIAVHKSAHEMLVFSHKHLIKIYKVQLGLCPVGAKQCTGDLKTPEGLYYINGKNPYSRFHKSLSISYPNAVDLTRAHKLGKDPGGDVMIHGLPNGEENVGPNRYRNDWTWGCIAIRNNEIDELFSHIDAGVPILITP